MKENTKNMQRCSAGIHRNSKGRVAPRLTYHLLFFIALSALQWPRAAAYYNYTIIGVGPRFVHELFERYSLLYPVTQAFRGVALNMPYGSLSLDDTKDSILNGTYSWGVGALPLDQKYVDAGMRLLPCGVSGTAIAWNPPAQLLGLVNKPLNITQEVLLGVFNGTLKRWDDQRLLAPNPELVAAAAKQPGSLNATIRVVVPKDTEWAFTGMLSAALTVMFPQWFDTVSVTIDGTKIPGGTDYVWADEVGVRMAYTDGSISYLDIKTAAAFNLSIAAIQNKAGNFVLPTQESYSATAVEFSRTMTPENPFVLFSDGKDPGSYPLCGGAYAMIKLGSPSDCELAYEVYRYIYWMLTDRKAGEEGWGIGFGRDKSLVDISLETLEKATCGNGFLILNKIREDIKNEEVGTTEKVFITAVSVMAALVVAVAIGMGSYGGWLQRKRRKNVESGKSVEVAVPSMAETRTQKELNKTVNVSSSFAPSPMEEDENATLAQLPSDNRGQSELRYRGTGSIYQARLVEAPTGETRAFLGPVDYPNELWQPDPSLLVPKNGKAVWKLFSSSTTTLKEGRPPEEQQPLLVAAPIVVRPKWQRSFHKQALFLTIRTLMDALSIVLNWLTLFSFPSELVLVSAYAALCIVGSVFFAAGAMLAGATVYVLDQKTVEVAAEKIRDGAEGKEAKVLAYIRSELTRQYLLVVKEALYRVTLVGCLLRTALEERRLKEQCALWGA